MLTKYFIKIAGELISLRNIFLFDVASRDVEFRDENEDKDEYQLDVQYDIVYIKCSMYFHICIC